MFECCVYLSGLITAKELTFDIIVRIFDLRKRE